MGTINIISAILNVVLLIAGIWLWLEQRRDKETIKAQIKVWHNSLNGFRNSLINVWSIANNNDFSSVKDIKNVIMALIPIIEGINTSFFQERFFSEKEIKQGIEKQREQNESFTQLKAPAPPPQK
jgi:cadmium resistance protein CadD (predicted permease)